MVSALGSYPYKRTSYFRYGPGLSHNAVDCVLTLFGG